MIFDFIVKFQNKCSFCIFATLFSNNIRARFAFFSFVIFTRFTILYLSMCYYDMLDYIQGHGFC